MPSERRRNISGLYWGGFAVLACLTLTFTDAAAQTLPLKRGSLEEPSVPTCPALSSTTVAAVSPSVTDSLLTAGSRAAILGDNETASDLLREAAQLDPSNAIVSYRLARTLDERGDGSAAMLEYCRYLSLAPAAPDTSQVRERLRALAANGENPLAEPWRIHATRAFSAFDAGRFEEAALAFGTVVTLRPGDSEAIYNRAVARMAAGGTTDAIPDLQAYLRMNPQAADRQTVQATLRQLGATAPPQTAGNAPFEPRWGPGGVLVRGLVVPGMAQFTTGRIGWGLAVLAGVGGALYLASGERLVTRTEEAIDPFGNPYEYEVTVTERPNQGVGIGAAVSLAIAAAVEGFLYARRTPRLEDVAERATALRSSTLSLGARDRDGGLRLEVHIPTDR